MLLHTTLAAAAVATSSSFSSRLGIQNGLVCADGMKGKEEEEEEEEVTQWLLSSLAERATRRASFFVLSTSRPSVRGYAHP